MTVWQKIGAGLAAAWKSEIADRRARERWLEWLVILVAVIRIAVASSSSIQLVNSRLASLDQSVERLQTTVTCPVNPDLPIATARMSALTCLEQQSVRSRYQLTALTVQSKIWTRYYAAVAGFLLIAVGAIFIIMKVRESPHELGAGAKGVSVTFKSASPGLAMTVLGTLILITSVLAPGEAKTVDSAAYVSEQFAAAKADPKGLSDAATKATEGLIDPNPPPKPAK